MIRPFLSKEILEKKASMKSCLPVYCSSPLILPVLSMNIMIWKSYLGSNDLSQVLSHHHMGVPSDRYTFMNLVFLFSFLEGRLKNEAFRSLKDVIQRTFSHVLTLLWKEMSTVEANST